MVRRYQIRLMRSVNARCVSIGLVLALSNCSESGGEPDAMLDMHHPGTGIDSHHPQFHNSYGNMKFIIIVINPIRPFEHTGPFARLPGTHQDVLVLAAFLFALVLLSLLQDASLTTRQTSFVSGLRRELLRWRDSRNVTHVRPRWRVILPPSLLPPYIIIKEIRSIQSRQKMSYIIETIIIVTILVCNFGFHYWF